MSTFKQGLERIGEALLMAVVVVVAMAGSALYAIASIVYFLLPFAVVLIAYRLLFG